ncbi:54S ribosomal protein yml6, mitochondrial [Cryomyces antarcticus]|uniref:Large ribosomal subunit protein uL4m n=1 Tax=Cryomyces antarcticus TaxID=329879 RepID=A0ABR0LYL7_9PEZI|nr:54S ribosomal protein yml6, mitochondrial [Cryomyces antarcticus]
MASKSLARPAQTFVSQTARSSHARDSLAQQCLIPTLTRSMATETSLPGQQILQSYADAHLTSTTPPTNSSTTKPSASIPAHIQPTTATATLYAFPSLEPLRFLTYPSTHLLLPLRRDILHRAVIFEGDATRQGTASTKWRADVHGSGRKIRPQKGTGHARLGDKKSPMLRGGGVAFGPHPRDFSTKLNRKIYDLAWRTALSYRYQKGELVIVENAEIESPQRRYVKEVFEACGFGNAEGRSTVIVDRNGVRNKNIREALEKAGEDGRVLERDDVDVKDLLETGRLIVERKALARIFEDHVSDLTKVGAEG